MLFGGRFRYIKDSTRATLEQPLISATYSRNGIEWRIYREFIRMNPRVMKDSYNKEQKSWQWDALLELGHIGRVRIEELIPDIQLCQFEVDDLVDRDVLIPLLEDRHSFKPAFIGDVCDVYESDISHNIPLPLLQALHYPAGRTNGEQLEWYCSTESLNPSREYLSLILSVLLMSVQRRSI